MITVGIRRYREKVRKGLGTPPGDRDEEVLGVPDGAHGAPDGDGEGQGEKENPRRDALPGRKKENDRCPDDGQGVVHENGRCESHGEEDEKNEPVHGAGPAEQAVRKQGEIAAFLETLPDDEHAEQEKHHIGLDGAKGIGGVDPVRGKEHDRPGKHDLPDLEPEPADLAKGDQAEDKTQNRNGNHRLNRLSHALQGLPDGRYTAFPSFCQAPENMGNTRKVPGENGGKEEYPEKPGTCGKTRDTSQVFP